MAGFQHCSILTDAKARFLQIADDYAWLNPHLTLTVDWLGKRTIEVAATDRLDEVEAVRSDLAALVSRGAASSA